MLPFPDKKYGIIYADPPWSYSNKGTRAAADRHYGTMTIEEIKKMPVNIAGGGYCLRRLRSVYLGDLSNAEGGPRSDRGMGLRL